MRDLGKAHPLPLPLPCFVIAKTQGDRGSCESNLGAAKYEVFGDRASAAGNVSNCEKFGRGTSSRSRKYEGFGESPLPPAFAEAGSALSGRIAIRTLRVAAIWW
jgi:hypothetical protein